MLVVARCLDESIDITVPPSVEPTTISVVLTDIRYSDGHKKARIGVEAPPSTVIDRHEVTLRKLREAAGERDDGYVALK